MKYFSPSYWFKLWVLSAPLFNDKTQGINAKSIDNKKIKDWASNNTTDISLIENQQLNFTNSNITNQPYNLNQTTNQNINPIYQTELETSTHKHRHEESRYKNRIKRENSSLGNKIRSKWYSPGTYNASLKPDFWDEVINLYYSDNENFIWKIVEKMNQKNFSSDLQMVVEKFLFAGMIKEKFAEINRIWQESDKTQRIKIKFAVITPGYYSVQMGEQTKINYDSAQMRTDDSEYSNIYWENLKNDFPDYNNKEIKLGLINNYNDNEIKNVIKNKYSNLVIEDIEILDKQDYSHFCECFSIKIKGKNINKRYSHRILAPKFTFVTQTKLNEISNIIANDSKIKQWISHINDWDENLSTKIDNLKTHTASQKWSAKNIEKEIIKSYIRDWSYVHTLIEHEFKLDELNENLQGLKSSFESLKNKVNTLDNQVTSLWNAENERNAWNCANIADRASAPLSLIPEVGKIASGVSKLIAGTCKIMKI